MGVEWSCWWRSHFPHGSQSPSTTAFRGIAEGWLGLFVCVQLDFEKSDRTTLRFSLSERLACCILKALPQRNLPLLLWRRKRDFHFAETMQVEINKPYLSSICARSNEHMMKILWQYPNKDDKAKKYCANNFDGTAQGNFSHNTIVSSSCP